MNHDHDHNTRDTQMVAAGTDGKATSHAHHEGHDFLGGYKPLVFVLGFVLLASVVLAGAYDYHWHIIMQYFMGGYFLAFSGFKLFNLRQFAQSYPNYSFVARYVKSYGYVFPFIELGLGVAYLANFHPVPLNIITGVLLSVNGLGVLSVVMGKKAVHCACLGSALDVRIGAVTLVEDFGMAAMALYMVWWYLG